MSILADLAVEAFKERTAIFEAFIATYLRNTGLTIVDVELIEDRSDPKMVRFYIRPLQREAYDLDS